MNYIDLVLALIILIAAIQGFRKGFIVEIASLAALILGIWGAIKFSDWTAGFISNTMDIHSKHIVTIAFIVTFIVIVVVIHILGKMLDNAIKAVALGFLNRLAGIIFGVLKTAVILSILLLLFDSLDENVHILPANQKQESKLYQPMKQIVPTLFPFIRLWNTDKPNSPAKDHSSHQTEIKTT